MLGFHTPPVGASPYTRMPLQVSVDWVLAKHFAGEITFLSSKLLVAHLGKPATDSKRNPCAQNTCLEGSSSAVGTLLQPHHHCFPSPERFLSSSLLQTVLPYLWQRSGWQPFQDSCVSKAAASSVGNAKATLCQKPEEGDLKGASQGQDCTSTRAVAWVSIWLVWQEGTQLTKREG